jgi:hypothetical protein
MANMGMFLDEFSVFEPTPQAKRRFSQILWYEDLDEPNPSKRLKYGTGVASFWNVGG